VQALAFPPISMRWNEPFRRHGTKHEHRYDERQDDLGRIIPENIPAHMRRL